MCAHRVWSVVVCLAAWLSVLCPREAAAIDLNDVDVSDRSYVVLVSFAGFFNPDCYFFADDNSFVGTQGLLNGEWSNESETFALFFTINYVEVELLSATEATITAITALDNRVLVGLIDTNDGDSGFFVGFESQICAIPGREPADEELQPIPDHTVPPRKKSR